MIASTAIIAPRTPGKAPMTPATAQAGARPCAVVCPTEAIVPGDFDDPDSRVSRLRAAHDLAVRKPEAGTGPNVRYLDAAPAGLDPLATRASGRRSANR